MKDEIISKAMPHQDACFLRKESIKFCLQGQTTLQGYIMLDSFLLNKEHSIQICLQIHFSTTKILATMMRMLVVLEVCVALISHHILSSS